MGTKQRQGRTPPGATVNKIGLYALTDQQRVTLVVALRVLQRRPAFIAKIRTIKVLGKEGIDALSESIIRSGLEFAEITPIFGLDESNRYVACARNLAREGELEVDLPAVISDTDEGAYVMSWMWVSCEDAGLGLADD